MRFWQVLDAPANFAALRRDFTSFSSHTTSVITSLQVFA
jgi:hypothetical protein